MRGFVGQKILYGKTLTIWQKYIFLWKGAYSVIKIELVDYDNLTSLGICITQYVNNNIKDIVGVLLDILETDADFELDAFFPRDYLKKKPQECRDAIDELYEIICSTNIRDFIKPKYKYLLYSILSWWEDCVDSEEELITNEIDEMLKRDLDNENGRIILKRIQNFEEYYYICFEDLDFLPTQLSNLVMLYLQSPKLLEVFFGYDNLDDYIDLMECDLRDRYLEIRCEKESTSHLYLSDRIVMELISVIRRFQKRIPHFESRDEVQITADLQDAVGGVLNSKYGLQISREFTMGRAIKKLGETDLYIYKEQDGIIIEYAVLENKYIENFTNQYNQLMGYLNPNFNFGITLSLNRKMSLKQGFDEIENKLRVMDGTFKPVNIRRIGGNDTLIIVSEHIVPETSSRMKVYHLIFQLNDKERKAAAVLARKSGLS